MQRLGVILFLTVRLNNSFPKVHNKFWLDLLQGTCTLKFVRKLEFISFGSVNLLPPYMMFGSNDHLFSKMLLIL
jgi:hypothetical protein